MRIFQKEWLGSEWDVILFLTVPYFKNIEGHLLDHYWVLLSTVYSQLYYFIELTN